MQVWVTIYFPCHINTSCSITSCCLEQMWQHILHITALSTTSRSITWEPSQWDGMFVTTIEGLLVCCTVEVTAHLSWHVFVSHCSQHWLPDRLPRLQVLQKLSLTLNFHKKASSVARVREHTNNWNTYFSVPEEKKKFNTSDSGFAVN